MLHWRFEEEAARPSMPAVAALEAEASPCIDEMPVVALVAVGRVHDQAVLAQKADKRTSSEDIRGFEAAFASLLLQAYHLPASPNWRQRREVSDQAESESGATGSVHILADPQALCVVAVGVRHRRGGQQCPERVVQELLESLVRKLRAVETEEKVMKARPGKLSRSAQRMLREVIRSYRDPDKVNKVMRVYEKFDRFKGLAQDNVKRIMEKHLTSETLQSHTDSMSASAELFLKESICRRRLGAQQTRRAKAMLAAALLCTALALLTLLPLASRF